MKRVVSAPAAKPRHKSAGKQILKLSYTSSPIQINNGKGKLVKKPGKLVQVEKVKSFVVKVPANRLKKPGHRFR